MTAGAVSWVTDGPRRRLLRLSRFLLETLDEGVATGEHPDGVHSWQVLFVCSSGSGYVLARGREGSEAVAREAATRWLREVVASTWATLQGPRLGGGA